MHYGLENKSLERKLISAKFNQGKLKQSNREQYIPAIYDWQNNTVSTVNWHGSADIVGLTKANSFIKIPSDTPPPAPEKLIEVVLMD